MFITSPLEYKQGYRYDIYFFIPSLFDKNILFGKILMIKYKRAKYVLQNN